MGGGDAQFPASADDALGHPDHDYLRDDDGSCAVDLDAVNGLLAERLDAGATATSAPDELRDELMRTHGVRVWDRERTWSAQPKNSFRRREPRPLPEAHDYAGGDLSAPRRNARRSTARRKQNWALADDLLDDLLMIGVDADDKSKTWRAVATTYDFPEDLVEDAGVDVDAVQRLIAKRSRLKLRRKFHEADGIRDAPREHNVHIDDKKRTWSMQKRRLGTKAELVPALEDLD
ncbi:hypothetical protein SO694_00112082 [Aureococcus anophagefferens]|uniref:Myb-like domain-containing protein n=1 Tax=Aureococcus anophagefferens TaxID=44056 RepID=A0ABR1FX05_AURAN